MPDPSRSSQDEPNNLAAYAGRWIAKLWGRVVGHGGTPSQALQAAKSTRHKESPQISYVPTKNSLIFPAILDEIRAAIPNNSQVYLVGGAVRDAVLDITAHDLDFTLPKNSLKIARRVANKLQGAYYRMGDEHETGRVVITRESNKRFILDFSDLRGVDIEADLRARDFTINAMAVALENPQELLDPLNGIADLYNKHLRTCAP